MLDKQLVPNYLETVIKKYNQQIIFGKDVEDLDLRFNIKKDDENEHDLVERYCMPGSIECLFK